MLGLVGLWGHTWERWREGRNQVRDTCRGSKWNLLAIKGVSESTWVLRKWRLKVLRKSEEWEAEYETMYVEERTTSPLELTPITVPSSVQFLSNPFRGWYESFPDKILKLLAQLPLGMKLLLLSSKLALL